MNLDRVYYQDCVTGIAELPSNSVDLIVTSPPYYNLREYSQWKTYEEHLEFIDEVFKQCVRVLKDGGHICWNIQDNIPEPREEGRHYYPLMPDTVKIGIKYGLEWERNVIWNKNTATQKMFGSYPYPPTPIFMAITESILVFKKPGKLEYSAEQKEKSKLSSDEWFQLTRNLWTFNTEKASVVGHSAPFPIDLPLNFIKLMSCVDGIVMDPFMGSGTTALACIKSGRRYIGFEYNEEYFNLCNKRIKNELSQVELF
jgi:modification methylase